MSSGALKSGVSASDQPWKRRRPPPAGRREHASGRDEALTLASWRRQREGARRSARLNLRVSVWSVAPILAKETHPPECLSARAMVHTTAILRAKLV